MTIESTVLEELVRAGWTFRGGDAIAIKTFNSAVGPKDALAFLHPGDGFNRSLSFQYISEGSNVAAADRVLIPEGACDDQVARCVRRGIELAEKSIRGSYAMRLMNQNRSTTGDA